MFVAKITSIYPFFNAKMKERCKIPLLLTFIRIPYPFHIDSGLILSLPSTENSSPWATISAWATISINTVYPAVFVVNMMVSNKKDKKVKEH